MKIVIILKKRAFWFTNKLFVKNSFYMTINNIKIYYFYF